jgi:hypothetical protein
MCEKSSKHACGVITQVLQKCCGGVALGRTTTLLHGHR